MRCCSQITPLVHVTAPILNEYVDRPRQPLLPRGQRRHQWRLRLLREPSISRDRIEQLGRFAVATEAHFWFKILALLKMMFLKLCS